MRRWLHEAGVGLAWFAGAAVLASAAEPKIHCQLVLKNTGRQGSFIAAFNTVTIGVADGAIAASLWHLAALVVGYSGADSYTALAYLIGQAAHPDLSGVVSPAATAGIWCATMGRPAGAANLTAGGEGVFMAAFNAIVVGFVGGMIVAILWHLAALVVGYSGADSYTTLAFLIGWAGTVILILKA